MTKQFVTGIVTEPFALEGFVKIRSLSGESAHILALEQVLLRKNGETRAYPVEKALDSPLRIKFAGVDSPEAAKILQGAELIADREQAAPLEKAEFYIEDLRNLRVLDTSGVELGQISDIVEGGGGFLAEILLKSGEKRFVPFRNEFFGDIDWAKQSVGLLQMWILD